MAYIMPQFVAKQSIPLWPDIAFTMDQVLMTSSLSPYRKAKKDKDNQQIEEDSLLPKVNMEERIALLGIPDKEMTPAVRLAVTALLEQIEDMSNELARSRESLHELEQLVDVDVLAPIPNRRAFMRRLGWALAMQQRYNHPSSLLFFDLNDLKSLNDELGHAAGDAAIRHTAAVLASCLRESDFIARMGGDEFAAILYYADKENAERRAEDITRKMEETPLLWNGQTIPLTVACGVYAIKPGDDAQSALSAADTAMYVDKRRSRQHEDLGTL